MEAAMNTMMAKETEDSEEEGIEIVRAFIIEEVNLGKAREMKNGVALDTECTGSVAGEP